MLKSDQFEEFFFGEKEFLGFYDVKTRCNNPLEVQNSRDIEMPK